LNEGQIKEVFELPDVEIKSIEETKKVEDGNDNA